MVYEGTIYRPPSEARSLLVQVTIGCAWNKCTFCDMYKDKQFRVRPLEEIMQDLQDGTEYRNVIKKIFLCDGDALVLPTETLEKILLEIRRLYPKLEGVRVYASARDILRKTPAELKLLAELGMDMVYIGLESGSDRVLQAVDKGITKQEMIDAAAMLRRAGIRQSVSIISGLGGQEGSREHMLETADALNRMQPDYVGMLVLYVGGEASLFRHVQEGRFQLPSPEQVLAEMEILLEHLELEHCFFSSAHVSNYIYIKGNLPEDKEKMLASIRYLATQDLNDPELEL